MNPITEKQKASLNRYVNRAVGRIHDKPENIPLFIRISMSDLYDWDIYTRSTLKEICYMRAHNWHEGDPRVPKKSPYNWDEYEGWCYAKQETLAERVGCSEDVVRDAIKRMVADGVLNVREYKEHRNDKYVVDHYEYSINEEVVDQHERAGERKPSGRKANKGCFKKGTDKSDGAMKNHTPSLTVDSRLTRRLAAGSRGGSQPADEAVDSRVGEQVGSRQSYVPESVPELVKGVLVSGEGVGGEEATTVPGFPPENETNMETTFMTEELNKLPKEKLADYFFNKLGKLSRYNNFKTYEAWTKKAAKLLNSDASNYDEICSVIDWALEESAFWTERIIGATKVGPMEYFCDKYEDIKQKMVGSAKAEANLKKKLAAVAGEKFKPSNPAFTNTEGTDWFAHKKKIEEEKEKKQS